jgi:isoleucyl-tRNA synthetase
VWNSAKFFIDYANIEGFKPNYSDLDNWPDVELTTTDRWLLSRAGQAVAEATEALDRFRSDELIAGFEGYLDDLSNWYIRRSRRRFYEFDEAAFRTLWVGVVTLLRVIAPVMPFLTEHLWKVLVTDVCPEAPASVHLAGWPQPPADVDRRLLDEMTAVRRVVEAGRRARMEANLKLRQPLRKVVVRGAPAAMPHVDQIQDELRVKEVSFDEQTQLEVTVKPNYPVLGPRLGTKIKDVAAALASGDFVESADGSIEAAGETMTPDEVQRTEKVVLDGWVVAQDGGVSVAIDPTLTEELIQEGRAYDLVRQLNELRKQKGLDLTDRIDVRLPDEQAGLVAEYGDWIAAEVLAVSLSTDAALAEPAISKAG